eukprot:c5944_g1_i1.p1 GENE.c5944_g1_i1~~c5944_g1_i1.p1  ORF type:complete len:144 (-),score=17.05 c5944_g1_i1:333-764(-)
MVSCVSLQNELGYDEGRLRWLFQLLGSVAILGSLCRLGDVNLPVSLFGICALSIRSRQILVMATVAAVHSIIPDMIWLSVNTQATHRSTICTWTLVTVVFALLLKFAAIYMSFHVMESLPGSVTHRAISKSFRAIVDRESSEH